MNGANGGTTFTDSSSAARTMSRAADAVTSTDFPKYGSATYKSTLSTALVSTTSDFSTLTFGTGDFCVEFWLYFADAAEFFRFGQAVGAHTGRWYMAKYPGERAIYIQFNGADKHHTGTTVLNLSTWQHVAWSRVAGTTRIFVNGTSIYSAADTSSYQVGASGFSVGGTFGGNGTFYLDDLRITVGEGPSSDFTAPTGEL